MLQNIKTIEIPHKFKLRKYQEEVWDSLQEKKRVVVCMHRRGGKDILAWNYTIAKAFERPGMYFYCLPTYSQARKVIWESITIQGQKFLDFIPKELVHSRNQNEMIVRMVNGSTLQLVGSDTYDRLVGTNPLGIVFSEAALCDPQAWAYLRPILAVNDGWALFISTPRGKNWFYDLALIAQQNPKNWAYHHLPVDQTNVLTQEDLDEERRNGMSEDLIQQEFYCDWTMGVEGTYYGRNIDEARKKGQITTIAVDPYIPVHTAWDLGIGDSTCIIFYQIVGNTVRLIDYYEQSGEGLAHYARILQQKGYRYGHHYLPHDVQARELGTGLSRIDVLHGLGIDPIVVPIHRVEDGIEQVRKNFHRFYFDQERCDRLVKVCENYRKEFDDKRQVYSLKPRHDLWSHGADSLRILAMSLPWSNQDDSMSKEDFQRMRSKYFGGEFFPRFV